MIRFPCPSCGRTFETEASYAGRETACPGCGAAIRVPAADAVPLRPVEEEGASMPCPRCGEAIKATARVCRFCRAEVASPPAPAPASAPSPARRRVPVAVWVLLGVFGAVAVLCVGSIVLVLAGRESYMKPALHEQCRTQLAGLRDAVKALPGGPPSETGGRFWRQVARAAGKDDLVMCPAGVLAFEAREVFYRGPKVPWDQVEADGIVACDLTTNHPDGVNVLFKDGRIEFAAAGTPLHRRALDETVE